MWLGRTTVQNQFTYVIQRIINVEWLRPYVVHGAFAVSVTAIALVGGHMSDYTADNANRLMNASSQASFNSAGYVAANVANDLGGSLAEQVAADAENMNGGQRLVAGDEDSLSNVSSITTDSISRDDIIEYTVGADESVESIARQFGIAPKTVRWNNDLVSGESVSEGDELTILPMDGVLHKVESDDTPQSLADHYQADANYIVSVNDAEVDGLQTGQKILIPGGVLPSAERPQAEPDPSPAPTAGTFATTSIAPQTSYGNTYPYGQCTWYAKERRPDIPNMMGNAGQWLYTAQSQGMPTGSTPKPGAVAVDQSGFFGHVAVVEEVRGNTVIVSDMNYDWAGSISKNRKTHASEWSGYIY